MLLAKILTHLFKEVFVKHPFWRAYGLFLLLGGFTQFLLWLFGAASPEGIKDAVFVSTLWLIPLWWQPHRLRQWSAVIALLIGVLALPGFAYFLVYRQEFTQSLMMILFESNQSESQEYLRNYFTWWILLAILAFIIIPVLYWRTLKPAQLSKPRAAIYSLLALALVFTSPVKYMARDQWATASKSIDRHLGGIPPFQLALGYLNYERQLEEVNRTLLTMNQVPSLSQLTEQAKPGPTTVVLVIGESTSRLHMSLYGYSRDTNPELSKIRQELTLFDNVYAPRPYTIESLQQVLTFADQQHPDAYKTQPSLVAMMKQAGYHVTWITNQQTLTGRNTMLTTFAKQADKQYFLNNERRQNAYSFDEKVLPPFAETLSDPHPKKLIIVHLLGTHMKYSYRYPENFDVFKTAEGLPVKGLDEAKSALVNSYDNAIRYNDWVMSQLIAALKAKQQHSLLVYFSDHGEDVYDTPPHNFQGRNEAAPTLPMYSIPFMVWHSANWFNAQTLLANVDTHRQYDNADLIYTLADLMGLSFDGFQPGESLVNARFTPDNILVGDPYLRKLQMLPGTTRFPDNELAAWNTGSVKAD
ncbi:heptose-I-phosphate ethanolaminephosphotransferase [Methylophilus rhizosphaerae]|uniref:Heptose-I-phosphate ethanolaminephosphotransferase n=1 Tax=Methylophilus rhizosphaerae TaxID=492660 RepID=A0A1G9CE74_9PROT|nr:heptose-I-phosphate ethanolaminephosphotransferase [Methylophilus rhizosphaerae]